MTVIMRDSILHDVRSFLEARNCLSSFWIQLQALLQWAAATTCIWNTYICPPDCEKTKISWVVQKRTVLGIKSTITEKMCAILQEEDTIQTVIEPSEVAAASRPWWWDGTSLWRTSKDTTSWPSSMEGIRCEGRNSKDYGHSRHYLAYPIY